MKLCTLDFQTFKAQKSLKNGSDMSSLKLKSNQAFPEACYPRFLQLLRSAHAPILSLPQFHPTSPEMMINIRLLARRLRHPLRTSAIHNYAFVFVHHCYGVPPRPQLTNRQARNPIWRTMIDHGLEECATRLAAEGGNVRCCKES
ncbi:hypothetical protein PM082_004868 [Marasmius tenuissimus]|nr:hypothetical protein PM082_004868 [Marasmius tenuissimus]